MGGWVKKVPFFPLQVFFSGISLTVYAETAYLVNLVLIQFTTNAGSTHVMENFYEVYF